MLIISLQFKIRPLVDYRYELLYNYGNLGEDVFSQKHPSRVRLTERNLVEFQC